MADPAGRAGAPQLSEQHAEVRGVEYLRLVGLGALIGIPAALVAALFLGLVHYLENWLWDDLPDALGHTSPPWWLVVGLPAVGAFVVLAARTLLPGDGGHSPIDGIGGGAVPVQFAPGIALGSCVGMTVTLFTRVRRPEENVLATAGSFSAISALFGGPIVGGMMMVEGGLSMGAALLPVLLPGFVAAAIGYLIFVGFGTWGGLHAQSLAVPNLPAYDGTHVYDLLVGVAVGVAAALVVAAVRRGAVRIPAPSAGVAGMAALLVGGGLAVGLLAQVADSVGADSQDVLFSGQAGVPALVAADSTKIVLILLVAKAIGYAICLTCGFRGGPVFPAIFLGVALAILADVWFGVSPTLAVAVGAAAGMAAATRLLITSTLFAALLVGQTGADAVPAAVLAAAAAWLTIRAIDRPVAH